MVYKLIALLGKSGSGKDTILNHALSMGDFNNIVRTTTRPKRDNESIDTYHFISEEDWLKKAWLLASEFRGWHYGSSMADFSEDKINLGIFSPSELETIKCLDKVFIIKTIYIEVDDAVRLQRSLSREDHADVREVCRRYLADEEDFTPNIIDSCDYFFKNETVLDLDHIASEILKISKEL